MLPPTMDHGRRQRISDPGLAIARAVGQSNSSTGRDANPFLEPRSSPFLEPRSSDPSPLSLPRFEAKEEENKIFGSMIRMYPGCAPRPPPLGD